MEIRQIGKLVLVRHGESEWNKLGTWTGITDVHISEKGIEESKKMGELVCGFHFDYIFITKLIRTLETLNYMKSTDEGLKDVPIEEVPELNERDYGDYTGKNKWEVKEMIGEEEFQKLRRGWDYDVPHGENLKMVYDRAVPFFLDKILPMLKEGKNVLVVAHGNSLRAVIKYIEDIPDEEASELEMPFGGVIFYDLNTEGHIVHKEIKQI